MIARYGPSMHAR